MTIHRLAVVAYEYPELVLEVQCSGGTYIRALGRDLAESLGTAAVMSALVRTAVGSFTIAQAADPRQLNAESCAARLEPLVRAVEMLPKIVLSAEEAVRIGHGLTIRTGIAGATAGLSSSARPVRSTAGQASSGTQAPAHEMAAMDESGRLVAIVGPTGEGLLRPLRTFPPV